MPPPPLFKGSFSTPIGIFTVKTRGNEVEAIHFGKKALLLFQGPPLYKKAMKQIQEYCQGKRKTFDLPYTLQGTPFQLRVWIAMAKIPFGETISYKELAIQAKSPRAFRAVGGACHNNPLPLVIPCHRVLGSQGQLTGFGGGVAMKKCLLHLEGR